MYRLIADTYRYRELIWLLARKELLIRYKRSKLGYLWALLHPLLLMIVLTVVFSTILRFRAENYIIFMTSALLPWIFLSQSLAYASESLVRNSGLMQKVYVPHLVFPVAAVLSAFINFLLSLIPLLVIMLFIGFPLHPTLAYLPVPIVALALFTLGCGLAFSAATVLFRDVPHILQILLRAWFYLSPILYSLEHIDPKYHAFFRLNPMLYILNGFRLSIYHGSLPSPQSAGMSLLCGVIAVIVGFWLFRHYENSYVDYL